MGYAVLGLICLSLIIFIYFQNREMRNLTKQMNDYKYLRVSMINKPMEKLASVINRNTNNYKQREIDILNQEQKLKQSIANISHDLRTPLTSIAGYISMMEDASVEDQERYLKIVEQKSRVLGALIDDFYDLSKYEDNGIMELQRINITNVISESLIGFYEIFKKSNFEIDVDIISKEMYIMADEMAINRIINNLITNSLKYGEERISIMLTTENKDVVLKIRNDVSSLEQGHIPHLFDRFYMTDKSRSKGGTGLGLYIVKMLVEKHDGVIKAELIDNSLLITIRFKRCE